MEFLILSDSHGNAARMQTALKLQPTAPLGVFYLGDGFRDTQYLELNGIPLYAVKGNCDLFYVGNAEDCPEERIVQIGSHRALLTHGARYGVKSGLGGLIASAVRQDADIVLYGHTHVPKLDAIQEGSEVGGVVIKRPLYVFNPGSIGQDGSFGTLTVQGKNVLFGHGRIQ